MTNLVVRAVTSADLDAVAALEAASYPPDEAASRERLAQRIAQAGDCFLVGARPGDEAAPRAALVGFVCGTRAAEATLTHASMAAHVPAGPSLCIHSVVVAAAHRRQGLATRLLAAYVARARSLVGVERLLLICKQPLIALYAGAGFTLVGPSPVVHGRDPWFEMRLEISPRGD